MLLRLEGGTTTWQRTDLMQDWHGRSRTKIIAVAINLRGASQKIFHYKNYKMLELKWPLEIS